MASDHRDGQNQYRVFSLLLKVALDIVELEVMTFHTKFVNMYII